MVELERKHFVLLPWQHSAGELLARKQWMALRNKRMLSPEARAAERLDVSRRQTPTHSRLLPTVYLRPERRSLTTDRRGRVIGAGGAYRSAESTVHCVSRGMIIARGTI
jgi:hypothetical protein